MIDLFIFRFCLLSSSSATLTSHFRGIILWPLLVLSFPNWILNPGEKVFPGLYYLFLSSVSYIVFAMIWLLHILLIGMSANATRPWATLRVYLVFIEPGIRFQWASKLYILADLWWMHMHINYLLSNIAISQTL